MMTVVAGMWMSSCSHSIPATVSGLAGIQAAMNRYLDALRVGDFATAMAQRCTSARPGSLALPPRANCIRGSDVRDLSAQTQSADAK